MLRLTTSLSSMYSPRHYVIADTDVMSLKKVKEHEDIRQNDVGIISYHNHVILAV